MRQWILGVVAGLTLVAGVVWAQPFPQPIAQAIALLTAGTTSFAIVGVDGSGYVNFGTGRSSAGYGVRDNAGTIESKNSGGSWSPLSTSGGAPSTATYITQTANSGLSAEQALASLGTALVKNTTGTGVLSAYAGSACTNQFVTAISAVGAVTCADVNLGTITLTGALTVPNGGTGLTTVAQGDLLYGSASNTLSALTKDTNATRYLSNTGGTNNPAWAQVALATGVSGTLPVANGGSGLTSGTSGGVLGYTATGTLASSVLLTNHAIVLGAGAGATPTPLASLGTTVTVLHGAAAGAPTWGAVNLATDTTGSLGVATGGTGIASYTIGDLIYASGATTLSKLADSTVGKFLRAGGAGVAPAWSTTIWTNSATQGDLLYASAANTYANLIDVTAGSYLRSGGVATAPVWSTTTLPNSATTGDVLYASAANVYSNLPAVATARVLASMGVGTAPSWLTDVPVTTLTASTAVKGPGTVATAGDIRLQNTGIIAALNAAGSQNITLATTTAANHVVYGNSQAAGVDLLSSGGSVFLRMATPTISAGFGTTPSIAGVTSAFKVTVGGGGDTSGVVLFASTWTTAPVCVAQNQTTGNILRTTPTTTQVTLTGTMAASDIVGTVCVGY